jgi:hypothetical protein
VFRYQTGEAWHFTDIAIEKAAAVIAESRFDKDTLWDDKIIEYVAHQEFVTASQVLDHCIYRNRSPGDWKRGDQMRVTDVLKRHKWSRGEGRDGGSRKWENPDWNPFKAEAAEADAAAMPQTKQHNLKVVK